MKITDMVDIFCKIADDKTEKLADYAHSSWSHWMKYLFSKSEEQDDGSVVIPKDLVERWKRQMKTSYSELPEKEKASDRDEANKIKKITDS